MDEETDEALYGAWHGGDAEAGNRLARRYTRPLLRFFLNKVPDVAEDLMQRTFLDTVGSGPPPDELRSFRALLFGVARKRLLRFFEGRGQLKGEDMMSRISLADLQTTPTQRIAREQSTDLLHQALRVLPVDDQITIELYYWQKLAVAEVAAAIGMSEGGVRAKLHRARARLRKEYERLTGETLPGFS